MLVTADYDSKEYGIHKGFNIQASGISICNVTLNNSDRIEEIRKANAKLIAAAPDLLGVLQKIVDIMQSWDNVTNDGKYKNIITYAEQAIQKATK